MEKTPHPRILSLYEGCRHLFCCTNLLLLIGILISLVPLAASETDDILGPESGYIDLRWRSNDKIVAIKSEYEFFPDKLNYDYGEIIKVTYNISVDTGSRGYLPNRTYYLLSPYVTGYQISGSEPLYWRIMKSEIDTLEVITDDKPLKGEFTLQLVHYKDRPQKKQLGDDSFMYFTPIDTTITNTARKSRPPAFNLKVYRVATTQTGANVHQHSSGKFYFDQQGGIALSGKTQKKRTQETLQRGYYAPSTKDNTYLPPQPNFTELAQGGIPGYPIKTLRDTVLKWRINNDVPPAIITSVGFTGNPLGCSVVINPTNTSEYILTTGNVTGNVRVSFSYILNGSTHTGYNDHNIILYYNFHGHISYNHQATSADAERETFIGSVILWGKNLEGEQFSIISEQSINSSANGYFCFNNISIPIVQVGFYAEYDTVPILYFYRNEDSQDIYYKYKNGVGFHHPESTSLCDNQLNFNADYRIMLTEGESPDNVFINDLDNGIIRFKDSMSCCALNIAYQMERLKDFFASQYSVQLNYQTMDFVVLVDRSREDVGNAYYQNGGGIVSGRSAISYRGAENLPELVTAWSNATILHELTHLVHDKLSGINVGNTINWVWAGPELHEDLENKRKIAYIEGMAFYIPCLIQKETTHMFWDAPVTQFMKFMVYTGHQLSINQVIDIETGQADNQNVYPRFDHYAGSTACILWDLSDNHNDTSIQYNYDVIDFTKSDVFSYISYNSSSGCPQILCQFLNRMWTSNLMSNQEIKNKFRLLCENRDIPASDYNLYKLSVGNDGLYGSISEAIAASCDGDVIVIEPGLYGESLCLEKSITLEGDTTNANDVVVEGLLTIDNDQSIAIKNISFTNPVGNGIEVCNSFVDFENVNIETCD